MKYNPQVHHRRSIRLKGYDYSQAGLYFITICCQDRKCRFGKIENDEMIFNEFGIIAYNEWENLPMRFPNFELDVFQIMPNHMHGIILLSAPPVGAGFTPAQNNSTPAQNDSVVQNNLMNENVGILENMVGSTAENTAKNTAENGAENGTGNGTGNGTENTANATIGNIVGAYKSLVANSCLKMHLSKSFGAGVTPVQMGKLWQRNYYEHIIRNEQSYQTISNYIINNPAKWNCDKFYNI